MLLALVLQFLIIVAMLVLATVACILTYDLIHRRWPFEGFRWWCRSLRGLYVHVQLLRHMRLAADRHFGERPYSPAFMAQLRQQEGMIGHVMLKVVCVYPNQDDGFGPPSSQR
jgi:hypothetical protein